jgi:hypothetical protein
METFAIVIEPIIQRLVVLLKLLRRENLVACKRAREEEENGRNENRQQQQQQQHHQHQQQYFDEIRRLLIALRGAIDNATVMILRSNNNSSNENWCNLDVDDEKRIPMTTSISNQQSLDDIIRMANGTASILRDILLQRQSYTANRNDKVSSIGTILHQSRYYACMEEAALTLTSLWKMVAQDGISQRRPPTANNNDNGRNSDGNNDKVLIITIVEEFVLPSLIACAVALSSLDDVPATAASVDASNSNSSSSSADNDENFNKQALDTGEDCIMALFTCIQSFFIPIPCDNNINNDATNNDDDKITDHGNDYKFDNDNDFLMQQIALEVGSAMKGALVARLVENCLTVLTPNQEDDTIARNQQMTSPSSSSSLSCRYRISG